MQVLTRYVLQKLFGPRVAGLTNDKNILYLDLPSNMVSLSLPPLPPAPSPRRCMHTHSEHFKGFTWKKMHLNYFTFDIKTSYFNVILSVWFPLEESLWITNLVFFFNVYIIHMLGFCEKIIVVGDVVEESLILELCGYSSMFTLLKIKLSY